MSRFRYKLEIFPMTNLANTSGSERLEELAKELIKSAGEDLTREGLIDTPLRFSQAMTHLTRGYTMNLEEIVNGAIFTVPQIEKDIVIIRDIHISSLCEHHLLPFHGTCHVGYIPNGKVLGLSKVARIADMFAARFQIQERLGMDIATAIESLINAQGVAVFINASHTCMTMRGVAKPGSTTTTMSTTGLFQTDKTTRSEFLALLNQG